MRFLILPLVLFINLQPLLGRSVKSNEEWPIRKQEFAEKLVDCIQQSTVKSLVSRYCMRCVGEGAAMCGGPIERISLSFNVIGPLSKNEMRRLLLAAAHEMVLQAYQIPNLDTYLATPPFSHENVRILIFQNDPSGYPLSYPTYNVGSFYGTELCYKATDPGGGPYKEIITETYEEALEALRKEYEQYKTAQMLDTSTSEKEKSTSASIAP